MLGCVTEKKVRVALMLALAVNFSFWLSVRGVRREWGNVSRAPHEAFSAIYGVGDKSFSYRINGLMLQNSGDSGGRVSALKDYDYERLKEWFFLQDKLDPVSDFMPYLAAYYFGGVQEPEKYRPVLDYLEMVGARPEGIKWRWLVHAVFFARHKLKDLEKSLALAQVLSSNESVNAPSWIHQMPAFVLSAKGDKKESYALLVRTLNDSAEQMSAEEIMSTRFFICRQVLDKDDAKSDPLCEGIKYRNSP